MEAEKLRIFDDQLNEIGIAPRSEVHRKGYWHEVFHCWFVSRKAGEDYIYLQLRSKSKKDYPDLFDITAAGHLLADETVEDGVREIAEEIGINVPFDELVPLGIFEYIATKDDFIDKEIANVFLLDFKDGFDEFTLQTEEVSGMVKVRLNEFVQLWTGEKDRVEINGFVLDENGERFSVNERAGREKFVPHQRSFYNQVIQKIVKYLNE
ncbi:NUDIX hydrolase [Evansella clarkii]|jgi:isopentenyldiphosphate isomerase|uniref:NUDIX hydrolase n=1 Tax=Evansella clarkii TaxID=79879 RepID=UPI0009963CB4|nr:NUDIX domain-containing protein [Evansella clarkii]